MGKEPPPKKKHVYIYVEVNQVQHVEKEKKKKNPNQQNFNSPIYSSSNNRLKTNKRGKMPTLFPAGSGDLGWSHIPGARSACIRRLENPGAEGGGNTWQAPPKWTWSISSSLQSPQLPDTGRRS